MWGSAVLCPRARDVDVASVSWCHEAVWGAAVLCPRAWGGDAASVSVHELLLMLLHLLLGLPHAQ